MGRSSEKARRKELTAAQARKVLAELVATSSGEELTFHSVEDWLADWLSNKAGSASARTMDRYRQIVRDFLRAPWSQGKGFDSSCIASRSDEFPQPSPSGRTVGGHLQHGC